MLNRRNDAPSETRLWRIWAAIPVVLFVGLAVAVGAGALIQFLLQQAWLGTPSGTDQTRLDTVRLALYVVGGIGGVVALVVAYRRQRVTEDANARENNRNFNDRFLATCAALGNDSAAVRLAAVYAIARLADDWRPERQACIDVLCAYLRLPYQPEPDEPDWKSGEREVRLSIIRVIRDHLRTPAGEQTTWQGSNLDFTGATFDGGDFTGTNLSSGVVSFAHAQIYGEIDFTGAALTGGVLSFEQSLLDAGCLKFDSVSLTGTTIRFDRATLQPGEIDFTSANLGGGEISFRNTNISGVGMHFFYTAFAGTRVAFLRSQFTAGQVDFDGAAFTAGVVDFTNADFLGGQVTFAGARFEGGTVDLSTVTDNTVPAILPEGASSLRGLKLPAAA